MKTIPSSSTTNTPSTDAPALRWLQSRPVAWACLAALVGAYLVLGATAAVRIGLTTDEPVHLGTGYLMLTRGEYRFDRIHPPLARMWLALPLALQGLKPPNVTSDDLRNIGFAQTPFRDWVQIDYPVNDVLRWPRRMNLLLGAGLIIVVWSVLRKRDALAALFGAGFLAFSPHVLAHGGLATTDMAIILLFLPAGLALWWATGSIAPTRLLVAGLVVGAALACKFTAVLLLPVGVLMAVARVALDDPVEWRIGRHRTLNSRWHRAAAQLAVALGVGIVAGGVIWASYGFRYSAGPTDTDMMLGDDGPYIHGDDWTVPPDRWGPALPVVMAVRQYRLLPEAYLSGLVMVMYQQTERHAFFMSHDSGQGWWYYFPLALLFKTPVSMLVVLGAGAVLGLARWWACPRRRQAGPGLGWPALIVASVLLAAALTSRFNIGVRHFLPILPPLVVLAAFPLAKWAGLAGPNLGFIAVLGLWQAGAAVWIRPDYLSYFNVLIGGPSEGYNYLVDSNLDWGQDLPKLADRMKREGIETVKLAYFGTAYPNVYGVRAERLPDSSSYRDQVDAVLEPGWYVVSATYLQGIHTPMTRVWIAGHEKIYRGLLSQTDHTPAARALLRSLAFHRLLCRLRARPPDRRAGYSLFVYRVEPQEFQEVFPNDEADLIRRVIGQR